MCGVCLVRELLEGIEGKSKEPKTGPRDCLPSWAEDADDPASMRCRPWDDKGSSALGTRLA